MMAATAVTGGGILVNYREYDCMKVGHSYVRTDTAAALHTCKNTFCVKILPIELYIICILRTKIECIMRDTILKSS